MDNDTTRSVIEGDVFEWLPNLPDDVAHAAVVDYPWDFNVKNGTGRFEQRTSETRQSDKHDSDSAENIYNMEDDDAFPILLDELSRAVVDGGWSVFFADDRFQDVIRDALRESDEWIFRRNWAWSPVNIGMGYYGRVNHYPVPVATNGETDRYVQDRGTLFSHKQNRQEKDYPTEKPWQIVDEMVAEPVLSDGETLLEPFCGSAPGAAVAGRRGLGYIGGDLNPEAVEMAKARLDDHGAAAQAGIEEF